MLAAAIVLIIFLAVIVFVTVSNARKRQRELDEYMRVAQQTSSSMPHSSNNVAVQPNQEKKSESLDRKPVKNQKPTQLRVEEDSKPKIRPVDQEELTAISEDLFFQPVTEMPDGQIVGYEIFREATRVARQNPIYVQSNPGASPKIQAEFELSTLEMTAAATQHEMWTELAKSSEIRFFVHISEALMDDKELWRKAVSLLKKSSKANPTVTLSVCSSAFANASQKIIKERFQKLNRLNNAGLSLALCGLDHDPNLFADHSLTSFYLSICGKEELLNCHAGDTAKDVLAAYQMIAESSLETSVHGIASEADVIDCLAAGAKYMSGDHLAPPRKLKS